MIGWLDVGAGASGDMLLGALVDAGVPLAVLQEAVDAVGVEPVRLRGEPVGRLPPSARRARGLLCAPEERNGHASAPDMSLTENAYLTARVREGLARHGFIDWAAARGFAARVIQGFDVRTPGPGTAARALSGGNLQKFVIGREIMQRPDVLVVNQPTWGVDAAAAAAIRQALLDLAADGAGVVVVSQDLDELLELCDRILVMLGGRIVAEVPREEANRGELGRKMTGADEDGAEP